MCCMQITHLVPSFSDSPWLVGSTHARLDCLQFHSHSPASSYLLSTSCRSTTRRRDSCSPRASARPSSRTWSSTPSHVVRGTVPLPFTREVAARLAMSTSSDRLSVILAWLGWLAGRQVGRQRALNQLNRSLLVVKTPGPCRVDPVFNKLKTTTTTHKFCFLPFLSATHECTYISMKTLFLSQF